MMVPVSYRYYGPLPVPSLPEYVDLAFQIRSMFQHVSELHDTRDADAETLIPERLLTTDSR